MCMVQCGSGHQPYLMHIQASNLQACTQTTQSTSLTGCTMLFVVLHGPPIQEWLVDCAIFSSVPIHTPSSVSALYEIRHINKSVLTECRLRYKRFINAFMKRKVDLLDIIRADPIDVNFAHLSRSKPNRAANQPHLTAIKWAYM